MFGVFIAILMIAITAYFVAVEFGVVKANKTKIKKLANEGDKKAQTALRLLSNMDTYLSACQLGITIASLVLGFIGEPAVDYLIGPFFELLHLPEHVAHAVSWFCAFSLVTFVHVITGELVPKTLAIRYSDKITMNLAGSLIVFYQMTKPIIWFMNTTANKISALFGVKSTGGHGETFSEEELILIMSDSLEHGEINQTEYKYVSNIFEFDELKAREIMVPRTDMCVIDVHDSNDEIFETMKKERYSRYPVLTLPIVKTRGFFNPFYSCLSPSLSGTTAGSL